MPILFGTLAALVMAIAAWTTYKNQDEYKYQIGLREKQENILDKNNRDKSNREEELQQEEEATKQLVADNVALTADLEKQASAKSALDSEIAEKQQLIDSIQAEDDIEKEEANLAGLKQVRKVTQADIDVKVVEAESIAQGKSQARLSTSIKTVYANWGFVTLNGGDTQGVVPSSTLDVVRGGEVVAKLKVTTVEPNRAAADIVKGSLKADDFLRSGDKVVAEALPEVVAAPVAKSQPVKQPEAPAVEDVPSIEEDIFSN